MPLQHISTNVLKSMRRGMTERSTEEILGEIRSAVPGIALRTTFIIGYPNETEADVDELCSFVERTRFDRLGVFSYSQEDDTYAHILGDPIPAEVKDARRTRVMDIQKTISLERNLALVGSTQRVLIDAVINGEYQGRTQYDAPEVDNEVFIRTDQTLQVGDFVTVEIEDAAEFDLFASNVQSVQR